MPEKVKGHLDQVGMLCSEQSWALAAPSSFTLGHPLLTRVPYGVGQRAK